MEGPPIRILIVDEQNLAADALSAALLQAGIRVTAAARDAEEAIAVARSEDPDVAIVDLSLANEDAISVGERLLSARPGLRLLGLAPRADDDGVRAALDSGFHGVLTKDVSIADLGAAIVTITRSHTIIPSGSVTGVIHRDGEDVVRPSVARKLTDREREILGLMVKGAAGPVIAKRLYLSPHTVRTHIQNILTKLGVHSRLEAVAMASGPGPSGSRGPR